MPAEDESEVGETSSMMESTMLEGEECYDPETSEAWTEKGSAIGQLCRICATVNEYLIPIFSGEGLEHQLGMKIKKHLPIQVVEEDNLPLHVCYQCASTVIAWHDLVIGCVKAERKLRQIYKKKNKEEEEEEDDYGDSDKADYFDEPIDSETAEDPLKPSTSTRPIRTPRKKKTVTKAKVKKKIAPVKSLSGEPETPLALLQPKEEQVDADTATERYGESHPLAMEDICLQEKVKEFPCELCPKSFDTAKILKAHYQLHSLLADKKTYGRNKAYLIPKHELSGEPVYSQYLYACDECDASFSQTEDLYNHKESSHILYEEENGLIKCRTCHLALENKEAFNQHYVNAHFKSSELVSTFHCHEPGCNKSYRKKQGLRQHLKKFHNRDRTVRYPCEVCGKTFTQTYTLSSHMTVHTGTKNYECHMCGKMFRILSNLNVHLLTHTTAMPVVCSVCNKRFRKKAHLTTHMRIHTGEKPYECDICGRRFNQSVLRNKHKLNVH